MTNNERITANNAELREAIEMAEKLPDASEGGIEHTYTVDYIPSVNTRAFTIPIHGFSFAPIYVDCRAVTEIPNPTGLQGAVRLPPVKHS